MDNRSNRKAFNVYLIQQLPRLTINSESIWKMRPINNGCITIPVSRTNIYHFSINFIAYKYVSLSFLGSNSLPWFSLSSFIWKLSMSCIYHFLEQFLKVTQFLANVSDLVITWFQHADFPARRGATQVAFTYF